MELQSAMLTSQPWLEEGKVSDWLGLKIEPPSDSGKGGWPCY